MGGTVAVTVRIGGEVINMLRWTNVQPDFVRHMGFINADREYLEEEYLKDWREMKADYEKHKDDKKFEHAMTDAYFPWSALAPEGYGLIVYDYDTKTILTMQDYTGFVSVVPVQIVWCAPAPPPPKNAFITCEVVVAPEQQASDYLRYKALFDEKRLKIRHRYFGPEPGVLVRETFDDLPATFDEFIKQCRALGSGRDMPDGTFLSTDVLVDISPWKIVRFDHSSKGATAMQKAIRELGFEFDRESSQEWATTITDLCEQEKEEEEEQEKDSSKHPLLR